ncbi:MAG: fimbrial protein [Rhizobiaceae bacterium]
MTQPPLDDDKPLDPAVEQVRRKMVRFFIVNIGLLMVALMAVLGAIVYKSFLQPKAPVAAPAAPSGPETALSGEIVLPAGSRILSQSLSGEKLALELELPGGIHVIQIHDAATGALIARHEIRFQ